MQVGKYCDWRQGRVGLSADDEAASALIQEMSILKHSMGALVAYNVDKRTLKKTESS
jgi:surfactin synthase thioesterase subunit